MKLRCASYPLLLALFLPVEAGAQPCAHPTDVVQLHLEPGQSAVTLDGLSITFVTTLLDDYDEGFDVLARLDFQEGDQHATRMPSLLAESGDFEPLLTHCWRLHESSEQAVVLEIGRLNESTSVPSCAPPDETMVELSSYWNLDPQLNYYLSVEVQGDAGEWRPAASLEGPRNRETHLEWTNLDQFPQLQGGEEGIRFTFRVIHRQVERTPDTGRWISLIEAEILSICRLTEEP